MLNYNLNVRETTEVKNYSKTASFYGTYDMAGNVWEWVNDRYGDYSQTLNLSNNPLGPETGQYRVLRGGSWLNYNSRVRSAFRDATGPTSTGNYVGFRCVRSP